MRKILDFWMIMGWRLWLSFYKKKEEEKKAIVWSR